MLGMKTLVRNNMYMLAIEFFDHKHKVRILYAIFKRTKDLHVRELQNHTSTQTI